jgi:hypothetical protein
MGCEVEKSARAIQVALLATLIGGAALAAGCPGEADGTASGNPTGAVCDTAIKYENDIVPLMNKYCTSCHAATLAPEDRHGAPLDHNYDSEISVIAYPEHTTDYAGAGPEGVNTRMPPAGWPQPEYADRQMLAYYLACYANGNEPPHDHDGGH